MQAMSPRFVPALLLTLAAAGCSDPPVANGSYGSTTPRYERPTENTSLLADNVTPVRVGELGANFAACNAQGEVRERAADGPIPVRAAPFEPAGQTGQLPPGSTFFICSRSHDQRWFGIVYDRSGQASRACGVSAPLVNSRDYEGPCESGWVASVQVSLISGLQHQSDQSSRNIGEPN